MVGDGLREGDEVDKGTYEVCSLIGEGGFGAVFAGLRVKATPPHATASKLGLERELPTAAELVARTSPLPVAIKRLRHEGGAQIVDFSSIREVHFLGELNCDRHPNILDMYDVFFDRGNLLLVSELCSVDLDVILRGPSRGEGNSDQQPTIPPLPAGDVKYYAQSILSALNHCHKHNIVHHDIKPDNFFLNGNGLLKLGDFGLARKRNSVPQERLRAMPCVWYRAPEIFFGSRRFTAEIDMWAAGCVIMELVTQTRMLTGETEFQCLFTLVTVIGPQNETTWPGVSDLPTYWELDGEVPPPRAPGTVIANGEFANATTGFADLVSRILVADPAQRLTVRAATAAPRSSQYVVHQCVLIC
mgnify:FL=1